MRWTVVSAVVLIVTLVVSEDPSITNSQDVPVSSEKTGNASVKGNATDASTSGQSIRAEASKEKSDEKVRLFFIINCTNCVVTCL